MYDKDRGLFIAHAQSALRAPQELAPHSQSDLTIVGKMANRHGLIAGATGTGKTVTLQVMAETFSQAGVPCFMADMKGDLSGIAKAGTMSEFIEKRMKEFGMVNDDASANSKLSTLNSQLFQACPVRFYDVYGEQGHPLRATVSQMGPQLLSRLLGLNDTQEGVLNIVFRIADDRRLLILDLKDLRSMLNYVSQHAKEYTTTYGNISSATVGAIQRSLLQLENQGADKFFGEPAFDINDLLAVEGGKGVMSVLAADKLMLQPKLYSTFLLWMISELYSTLPEVGDLTMPKLIFFFDEAHMLFDDTPKALTDKIEQVIRLIRSKGVGIYFISQLPTDIPDNILGQLGNRVQHALRAYTPRDQKAVRTAAETFRPNPDFKTEEAITQLETGEALVSFLDENGAPGIVQRAKILFPLSQIGAITPAERSEVMRHSTIGDKYNTPVDRESAYEILVRDENDNCPAEKAEKAEKVENKQGRSSSKEKKEKKKASLGSRVFKGIFTSVTATLGTIVGTAVSNKVTGTETKSKTSAGQKIIKNATSSATRTLTRELSRDILGNLVKK